MTGGRRLSNERSRFVAGGQRNGMRHLGRVARSGATAGSNSRVLVHGMLVSRSRRPLMDGLLMRRCLLVHGMLVSRGGCMLMNSLLMRRCPLVHGMLVSGSGCTLMDGPLVRRCPLDYGMLVRGCSLIRSPLTCDGCCPRRRRSMNSRR